jgi:hypothetical protein
MNDMSLTNLQAGKTLIDAKAIEALAGQLTGKVLDANDPSYDEVRTIWNAMIDRRPALIVQCREASDVVHAVRFARDNKL